ncbi:hypothetical protein BDF20DRAFT_849893 [Mycotypha africana]|uniref:uncharacterized protein n=1 Tax=Mycotypha africana TaxID=64632 RepID=UPI0023016C2C|nr:uncharacterized protein BDF20DRAFT_849893 [Mycotypha africana]KAI8987385.1 hypothetical protein BDF20DRAFT_849893 [Mycotypha africana]
MSASVLAYSNAFSFNTTLNEYTFCPHCGVDVTIFSHEDDCPSLRQQQENSPISNGTSKPTTESSTSSST